MRDSQLEKMSYRELLDTKSKIEDLIREKQVSERAELRQRMEAMAREAGLSVSEIFGDGRSNGRRRRTGKVAPKYRNPKNPAETWTGRGRRPRWMVAAGGDPKRFLIS